MRRFLGFGLLGIAALMLVLVAAVALWRLHRRDAVERALGRDLQAGMPLAEVTEYLRRLGVEFTVDSAAGRTTVVSYDRKVTRNGAVSEQQILFDQQHRLSDLRGVARISGR